MTRLELKDIFTLADREVVEVNGKQPISIQNVPPYSNTSYWTDRRRKIHAWLHEQAPSLAELYKGCVLLMFDPIVSGRITFISHAVREIRNRLPGETSNRLNYTDELEQLGQSWRIHELPLENIGLVSSTNSKTSLPSSSPKTLIPQQLFLEIQSLLSKHFSSRVTGRERALRLFERFVPESQTNSEVLTISVNRWWQTTEWFMKRAHDNGKVDAECDEQELHSKFIEFESFLGTLSQSFYSNTDELDEILEEANT